MSVLGVASSDLYYQKYQHARRELEMARKRWQMETEDEIEGIVQSKRTAERKVQYSTSQYLKPKLLYVLMDCGVAY